MTSTNSRRMISALAIAAVAAAAIVSPAVATSSPWAYNGHVFAINEERDTFVMKAGEEFEFVGINSLDEFVQASPTISGDRLLLRRQSKLYSIRETN